MIAEVLQGVVDLLTENVKDFYLEKPKSRDEKTGKVQVVSPSVYLGRIPDKPGEETFPCIVVTWTDCDDEEDSDETSIDIFLCINSQKGPSALELWTAGFADHVRKVLRNNSIILEQYERQWPVRTQRPDPKREHYQYAAVILSTVWRRTYIPQSSEVL